MCGYHIKHNCFSAIVFALKIKTTSLGVVVVGADADRVDGVNDNNDDIDKGN